MKKILIDTSAYAAFKMGNQDIVESLRIVENIAMSVVVLAELMAGFVTGHKEVENRKELSLFLDSPRVSVLNIDGETTEFYARIFRQLRKDGHPIPTNDMWIASSALQHGFAVFTLDKHFGFVDNLIVCRNSNDLLP